MWRNRVTRAPSSVWLNVIRRTRMRARAAVVVDAPLQIRATTAVRARCSTYSSIRKPHTHTHTRRYHQNHLHIQHNQSKHPVRPGASSRMIDGSTYCCARCCPGSVYYVESTHMLCTRSLLIKRVCQCYKPVCVCYADYAIHTPINALEPADDDLT